jgi:hypothetical protein
MPSVPESSRSSRAASGRANRSGPDPAPPGICPGGRRTSSSSRGRPDATVGRSPRPRSASGHSGGLHQTIPALPVGDVRAAVASRDRFGFDAAHETNDYAVVRRDASPRTRREPDLGQARACLQQCRPAPKVLPGLYGQAASAGRDRPARRTRPPERQRRTGALASHAKRIHGVGPGPPLTPGLPL